MQIKLTRIGLGAVCVAACAMSQAAGINWQPNYEAALKQAKATNKILMVEFYTDWDQWGKRLNRDTFGEAESIAAASKFVPVRVNVEKEGVDLAKRYHITNYPTVLFVAKDGRDVGTIDGFEQPAEFVKHAEAFLTDYNKEPGLRQKYNANPKNLDAVAGLGTIEADRYHIAAALNKIHEAEALDPKNATGKLSDLYNAVGDHYQNASKFDSAITYFKKAADTSKVTDKKAYALLSIATCYLTMDRPSEQPSDADIAVLRPKIIDHFKKALPYIKQAKALPNLKAEDKKIADADQSEIEQTLQSLGGN